MSEVGLAWSEVQPGRDHGHVMFRTPGGRERRLDQRGWYGSSPNLVGHTVVYQQYQKMRSSILVYDLRTNRRHRLAGVNGGAYQYQPQASERYVLFMRCYRRSDWGVCARRSLLLYDRKSDRMRILVRDADGDRPGSPMIVPGFAGDRYVAWTACLSSSCRIQYFDRTTGQIRGLRLRPGPTRYAPAIDEATGTIFFGQSRSLNYCDRATIRRGSLRGAQSDVVWKWPDRRADIGYVMRRFQPTGGPAQLTFERYLCRSNNGDIAVLRPVNV